MYPSDTNFTHSTVAWQPAKSSKGETSKTNATRKTEHVSIKTFEQFEPVTLKDGSIYQGQMKNGRAHGRGKITYSKEDREAREYYVGEMENGLEHGRGRLKFTNGAVYDCVFENGTFSVGALIYQTHKDNYMNQKAPSILINGKTIDCCNPFPCLLL